MRVPIRWLKDYVDVTETPNALAAALTMAGVGIEGIEGDVLDLEITSNRADLLSLLGVAREVALLKGRAVNEPKIAFAEHGPVSIPVEIHDFQLCPRYMARVVRGAKVGPSPAWMQEKLTAAGLRPVNNIVDITNFVLLECGQPLHAFDMKLLRGPKIVVRPATPGEKMTAIDAKEYALTSEALVIADANHPVAIAGVMGGKETEIHDRTSDVLIESAQFDPVSIRRTSRRLGLTSDSSYRFERGVDWETIDWASRRAAQLMAELAGGKVEKGVVDVASKPPEKKPFRFRPARVNRVLGMNLAESRIMEIVRGLGCAVQGDQVVPPSLRRDIKAEVDLIEEVARIEGYDKVPSDTRLSQRVAVDRRDDLIREQIRASLVSMGCFEVVTWSFSTNSVPFWSKEDRLVPLMDPTTGRVDRTLRNALGPGLVEVLKTNEDYKEKLAPIFEIADVYYPAPGGYGERRVLGIASPRGFAHLRGLVEQALPGVRVARNRVWMDELQIGYIAPVETDLRCDVAVAEIDFDAPVDLVKLDRRFHAFSRMPPVVRDLAVVLEEAVTWAQVEECVRKAAPRTLEEVAFFDLYRGKGIPEGHKSLAFSMTFRASDRTLTSEEVDAAVKGIVASLASQCKGKLR